MSRAYYNEFDPYAAAWLRNLIAAGHIAPGDVDERSIVDVRPDDLKGYTQCHFFAGIGGWSLAARLAGWPDDKPLWTGSCPCQPFSAAGKRKGVEDERHLWPVFAALIRECRPVVVAGEQVASKDGLGWLDGVWADLEAADYAVWAGDYCAAGVGAPHIRQRLWWLGHSLDQPRQRDAGSVLGAQAQVDGTRLGVDGRLSVGPQHASAGVGSGSRMADANGGHASAERQQPGRQHGQQQAHGGAGAGVGHADDAGLSAPERQAVCGTGRGQEGRATEQSSGAYGNGLAHADEGQRGSRGPRPGAPGGAQPQPTGRGSSDGARLADAGCEQRNRRPDERGPDCQGEALGGEEGFHDQRRGGHGFWSDYELIPCRDGTARRTKPGIFPLAHGVSGRVGKLRAAGNAIVPQVAAEILRAYLDGSGSV